MPIKQVEVGEINKGVEGAISTLFILRNADHGTVGVVVV